MRIGIDASYLADPLNGIGQVTTHFLEALIAKKLGSASSNPEEDRLLKRAHVVLFVNQPTRRDYPDGVSEHAIPVHRKGGILARKWWEGVQLPRAVKQKRCTAFFSLYQSACVLPHSIQHLMMVHDIIYVLFQKDYPGWRNRVATQLIVRGIRHASHLLANSMCTKSDVAQHLAIDPAGISVAHIAADPRFNRPLSPSARTATLSKYGLSPGYLYHGGGFDRRKNLRGTLQAYRILVDRSDAIASCPIPPLVLTGRMPDGESKLSPVLELIEEFHLQQQVISLGEVPSDDLPAIYSAAAMFVFPSFYEGFGLPLLEAMHMGVPIITSDVSALPEVAGDAALYCDPGSPARLADMIERLLADSGLREKLGNAGRARAKAFTWSSFIKAVTEEWPVDP